MTQKISLVHMRYKLRPVSNECETLTIGATFRVNIHNDP